MFKRTLTLVAATLAIAGFAGTATADDGHSAQARYQAVVLGNAVAHTGVTVVPQSTHSAHATYLIRNGEGEAAAVAATVGGQTRYRVVTPAPTRLSAIELHQKMLGRA